MKKLALVFILLLIFVGCGNRENIPSKVTEYHFNAKNDALFPFYCIDENDILWRVENKGAFSTECKVSDNGFIKYLRNDDVIFFTTDHYDKSGIVFGTLMCKTENSKTESIFENVRIDSIQAGNEGNLLFIDGENNLYFRRDGIVTRIEGDVAEAQFVGEDTFLFRLNKGLIEENETVYPIYSATADYRNFIMNGVDIIEADAENGKAYIIKNKRIVQKRASAKEVADCFVYSDGEVLFDIPSVLISQFNEDKHMFLICVNESASTLKYDLYRVDGAEPIKKGENVISGRYISLDRSVFAYEFQTAEGVKTAVIDRTDTVRTYSLGENCSLESIYYVEPYTYLHKNGELLILEENGIGALIDDGIDKIRVIGNGLVCFKENKKPYSISVCTGTKVTNKASEVTNDNVLYKDGLLYYYTGEGYDLNSADISGKSTALISNVTDKFISKNGTVAVIKKDSGVLYITNGNSTVDTEFKIKNFIKEE